MKKKAYNSFRITLSICMVLAAVCAAAAAVCAVFFLADWQADWMWLTIAMGAVALISVLYWIWQLALTGKLNGIAAREAAAEEAKAELEKNA